MSLLKRYLFSACGRPLRAAHRKVPLRECLGRALAPGHRSRPRGTCVLTFSSLTSPPSAVNGADLKHLCDLSVYRTRPGPFLKRKAGSRTEGECAEGSGCPREVISKPRQEGGFVAVLMPVAFGQGDACRLWVVLTWRGDASRAWGPGTLLRPYGARGDPP